MSKNGMYIVLSLLVIGPLLLLVGGCTTKGEHCLQAPEALSVSPPGGICRPGWVRVEKTYLMEEPTRLSATVGRAYYGQKVSIIEVGETWMQVEIVEDGSQNTKRGWILSKAITASRVLPAREHERGVLQDIEIEEPVFGSGRKLPRAQEEH